MEFVSGGNLTTFVHEHGPLSESQARRLFLQLIYALEYLHETSCVPHRDLRPENILIDKHSNLRLIDFGLTGSVLGERSITPFSSPSVAIREKYSFSSDVWSAGAVLFFLVAGHPPFDGDSQDELISHITTEFPLYPASMSRPLIDLLSKMLNKSKLGRITIPRIEGHPWFSATDFVHLKLRAEPNSDVINSEVIAQIARSGSETKFLTAAALNHQDCEQTVIYEILKREKLADDLHEALQSVEEVVVPLTGRSMVLSHSQQKPRVKTLRPPIPKSPRLSLVHAREEVPRRYPVPLFGREVRQTHSAHGMT
jgi:serine/threonine protein kinase